MYEVSRSEPQSEDTACTATVLPKLSREKMAVTMNDRKMALRGISQPR